MGVGTSDGQHYEDNFDYHASVWDPFHNKTEGKNQDRVPQNQGNSYHNEDKSSFDERFTPQIDRSHDVPLAASALVSSNGIAVDKDAKPNNMGIPGWDPAYGVYVHEREELNAMHGLLQGGMDPKEAYKMAHDHVANPAEESFVKSVALEHGKDPEQFYKDHQQYWKDVHAQSSIKEDPDLHPDAHTTKYGLDAGAKQEGQVEVPHYQTWPERLARMAYSAVTAPGDAYNKGMTPEEEVSRSADLASLMVGAPGKIPEGALGSFAGIRAVGADKQALAEAKQMSMLGKTVDEIWNTTGWFQGGDKKWRFEIPDQGMRLKDVIPPAGNLEDYVHHPELFKAYPHLKDMEVNVINAPDKNYFGMYIPDKNRIDLNWPKFENRDDIKDTLIHEIQHSIQHHEGFEPGGNAKDTFQEAYAALHTKYNELRFGERQLPVSDPEIKEIVKLAGDMRTKAKELGHYLYTRLPGEKEARMTEARRYGTREGNASLSPKTIELMNPEAFPPDWRLPDK